MALGLRFFDLGRRVPLWGLSLSPAALCDERCLMSKSKRLAQQLASGSKTLANLVQPDGWARGEREGYGEPCDVTSLSRRTPSTPLVLAP